MYTYIPSLLDLLPTLCPHSTHLRSPQSTELSSLHYIAVFPCYLFYKWQCTDVSPSLPIHSTPLFPLPSLCPQFIIYICISISALQIGSSVQRVKAWHSKGHSILLQFWLTGAHALKGFMFWIWSLATLHLGLSPRRQGQGLLLPCLLLALPSTGTQQVGSGF